MGRPLVNIRGVGWERWVPVAFGLFLTGTFFVAGARAQVESPPLDTIPPAPPTEVQAQDTPNDEGGSITITWRRSSDDGAGANDVLGYEIFRTTHPDSTYRSIGFASAGAEEYIDPSGEDGIDYYYKVLASDGENLSQSTPTPPARSRPQWINLGRKWIFLIALILSISIIGYIRKARAGQKLFIRKIAGLEAVDEAIGRATEMGKPILFIPGIQDMDNVQTIAGITILGRIARTIAEYDTPLHVPVCRSLVMTTARETVKEAYLSAGRPDAYQEDMIHYLTDAQFGYVAAVDGIMVRERPATCFYLGAFFAESLILAETGNYVGAIQIAGTAMPAQLPFFVTACDYTLIGEELFAASAYLSNEPEQLGSLKGQDMGKMVAMLTIGFGVVIGTMVVLTESKFFKVIYDFVLDIFTLR